MKQITEFFKFITYHKTEIDSNYDKLLHNSSYMSVVKYALFKNEINLRVIIILFYRKDKTHLFIIRCERRELL